MYKKRNNSNKRTEMNLDPLMDVLTCTVGVMLFVVIFAVIEARGVSFKFFTPMQASETPQGKARYLFICKEGRIKPLNITMAYDSLHLSRFTYYNMPEMIKQANNRNTEDEYFEFSYDMGESSSYWSGSRWAIININEKDPLGGDDKDQIITPESKVATIIKEIDPDKFWLAFAIFDEESIEVFREARSIANKSGLANGWDPIDIEFPLSIALNNSGGRGNEMFVPQK